MYCCAILDAFSNMIVGRTFSIPTYNGPAGTVSARPDLINRYAAYLRELVDLSSIRHFSRL
ncbi:hypothetical protein OHB12_15765 [Nocardia sp. NBC_01730]|uniref:hypothetical protein n=1 Tax=Nocardia sp. NBC_01730 TaxID=2975998 RepID=UPI002E112A40|nr:hypothetical protein OHB12_15765 [Nocardia sp. NBC_01730]